MLRALVSTACRLLNDWALALFGERLPRPDVFDSAAPSGGASVAGQGVAAPRKYRPLERVLLTDQVCRTLFDEFAEHRRGPRGEEEIGWVLLGVREERETLVLATLPAGGQRSAGVAHVRFNSKGQAIASRIVRRLDRRLSIVGVVHTHPGSLRHPSDGDYQGDSLWVGQLRGGEGVFGIGTADADAADLEAAAARERPHRQVLGDLCFSWYALGKGERRYRRLPVELLLGADLARPLHAVWDTLETHADALERLCVQQNGVSFEVVEDGTGPALAVHLPLAEKGCGVRLLLDDREVRYFVQEPGGLSAVDPDEQRIDRAVYLILAELAGRECAPRRSPGRQPANA